MRKVFWVFVIVAVGMTVFPFYSFAEEVAGAPPEWLGGVIQFIQGVPYVGPVVVEVLKWVGLISAVMTALSAGVQGVLVALSGIAQLVGLKKVAEVIKAWSDKILPWLKYLSVYNVQKKSV